jgi:predicted lysophospholipase L1 biosynthesis ABC-type transport system permease subunit
MSIALGARCEGVLKIALGQPPKLLAFGSTAGLLLGLLATRVLAHIVYTATPRDPLALAGVVLAMSSWPAGNVGSGATRDFGEPFDRAARGVNPAIIHSDFFNNAWRINHDMCSSRGRCTQFTLGS